MKVAEFRAILSAHPQTKMHWMLPDKSFVPGHYHITEVGRLQKDFIDCGRPRGPQMPSPAARLRFASRHDTTVARIGGPAHATPVPDHASSSRTGMPPRAALWSAAKITSNVFAAAARLVRGMSCPASRASKKAWNWAW